MAEDNIQHGIDDNPSGDAEKGAKLGGIGGVVTGAAAGAIAGPGGMIIGAIVGGIAGAAASGVAVAAVDRHDNDNTVTGLGDSSKKDYKEHENDWRNDHSQNFSSAGSYENNYEHAYTYGHELASHQDYQGKQWNDVQNDARRDWEASNPGTWDTYQGPIRNSWERTSNMSTAGNATPAGGAGYAYADNPAGIQTGGHDVDGSPDTRGITEKMADTVTGDNIDDKTGKRVD